MPGKPRTSARKYFAALLLATVISSPLQASQILIFGDSWAKPLGPALMTVLAERGYADVTIGTTDFWGLAARLSSPEGLAFISDELNKNPDVEIVQLVIGHNDVHCTLVVDQCTFNWNPTMAGTAEEAEILDTIIADIEKIVDHIHSILPAVPIFLHSYDYMRPRDNMGQRGTPSENNAVHTKLAERAKALASGKPMLDFLDLMGLMQVAFGFDGISYTSFDPSDPIPPGNPSLPDPTLPSPMQAFRDITHLNIRGNKVFAEALYDGFYASIFDDQNFQINAGHSGAWFNPETPGQGQLIDVESENQFLFLSWFSFTDTDSANPNEQHWFTAQGNYVGDTAELVVYETLGGQFDGPQEVVTNAVGNATLSFSDCANGQLDYTIDTWGLEDSLPMQRAIAGTENVCERLAELSAEPLKPNDGRDGAWSDPASPGQGFLIDAHPGDEGEDFIFVAWFTYGEGTVSGQRWLTAQGPLQGSNADLVLYETLGGSFNDPEPSETNAVGTMTIDFTDCSNALLDYSITDEALAGMIDIDRAIPATEALCEELTQ